MDFGLAKTQQGVNLTGSGETAGTLAYMPPEQVHGLARANKLNDLYSIGMTCYEMLAGRLPFDRNPTQRFQSADEMLEAVTRQTGTLHIYGSLSAGSITATEPRYGTRIRFDQHFEKMRPPNFPMTNQYEIAEWDERWMVK